MFEVFGAVAIVGAITLSDGSRTEDSGYQDAWIEPPIISDPNTSVNKIQKRVFRLATARIAESTKEVHFFDMGESAKFCTAKDEWICFGTGVIKFSIPKNITSNRWMYDGAKYELHGKTQLRMLGKEIDVYVIHGRMTIPREEMNGEVFPEVTKEWVFYFSDTHGLIAFETLQPADRRGGLYFATQPCGYAGLRASCARDQ